MRRFFALLALVSMAALAALLLGLLVTDLPAVVVAMGGLVVLSWGGWWLITEQMPRRLLGVAGLLAGLLLMGGALVLGVEEDRRELWMPGGILVLAVVTVVTARVAVATTLREADFTTTFPPFRPARPVLICNPRSGGGKVDRFDIAVKAREMGVRVILLEPGQDLERMARDEIAAGADCIGMAGGDGSQALVAGVAAECGVPFVCISAGTRNHFALDLGLDKDDPSTGLRCFNGGVLRTVDYARAGERVFVNNVSFGVYAQIVETSGYREAKLATAAGELPELLGRTAEPFDLQFTDQFGEEVDGSLLILVSNNPYILQPAMDVAQRSSLSSGQLGVFAVSAHTGGDAAALVARAALGISDGDPAIHRFTATTFEVRSRSGRAPVGIDGEALMLSTPLRFSIHPRGLTMLVPQDNPPRVFSRQYRGLGIAGLVAIALNRAPAPRAGTGS